MSRQNKTPAPAPAVTSATTSTTPRFVGPDGATPTKTMRMTGVVRTTRGYCVAIATVEPDGTFELRLGNSQSHQEFVHMEHKRVIGRT
jgi:hypothetical protein